MKTTVQDIFGCLFAVFVVAVLPFGFYKCCSSISEEHSKQLIEVKNSPNEKIIVVNLTGGLTDNDPLEAANLRDRFYKAVSAKFLSSESAALEGKVVFYEVKMVKREEYQ